MNQLRKLLVANRGIGIFRAVANGEEDTLYLYDVIVDDGDWGGVSAVAFTKALMEMKAPTIHLRINSPGGDVFAARAMEQAIREHPSHIIAHIDGLAASAASYVALAADQVLISAGGFFMIHKAMTMAFGNADELLQIAGVLEKVDESLVNTYASATGQEPDQIRDWLAAETWFNAEEALEFGFADVIAAAPEKTNTKSNALTWDLSAYRHAPQVAAVDLPTDEPDPARAAKQHTDHLMRQLQVVRQAA